MLAPFKKTLCAGSALLMLLPGPASAHFFAETANCRAPKKPLTFAVELDRQQFEQQVDDYRNCLENFVNRQNQAMEKHRHSAEQAAKQWRQYSEQVLGVKLTPAAADDAQQKTGKPPAGDAPAGETVENSSDRQQSP